MPAVEVGAGQKEVLPGNDLAGWNRGSLWRAFRRHHQPAPGIPRGQRRRDHPGHRSEGTIQRQFPEELVLRKLL